METLVHAAAVWLVLSTALTVLLCMLLSGARVYGQAEREALAAFED